MRLDAARGLIVVAIPPGTTARMVQRFLDSHAGWIASKLDSLPPACSFQDGACVPIQGELRVIRHDPRHRGRPTMIDQQLVVGGGHDFLSRRIYDHLRRMAKAQLEAECAALALRVDRKIKRLTLRDTTSRWGSCSADGRLSFSWRLILAPPTVLTYVAAHEVAHLVEMNHSPRFWRLVAMLCPEFTQPQAWLRQNSAALLRIGVQPP